MKSRIKKTGPKRIIGYMIYPENADLLKNVVFSLNAEMIFINESSANETIGFLAGFKGFDKSDEICCNPPAEQCLIMSGFDSKGIDKLILKLRENNISIPLKCVVTQHNQSWRLCSLINELKKEHDKMTEPS